MYSIIIYLLLCQEVTKNCSTKMSECLALMTHVAAVDLKLHLTATPSTHCQRRNISECTAEVYYSVVRHSETEGTVMSFQLWYHDYSTMWPDHIHPSRAAVLL